MFEIPGARLADNFCEFMLPAREVFLREFGEDLLLRTADVLPLLPPLKYGVFVPSSHSLITDGSLIPGIAAIVDI